MVVSAGWRDRAACVGHDPELWFADTDPAATHAAIAVCRTCPVMRQCRAHAIAAPEWHGTWGGLTPEELGQAIRAAGMRKPRGRPARVQAGTAAARRARAEKLERRRRNTIP